MKITQVMVRIAETPLTVPLRISLGTISYSRSAVVEVHTDEGLIGIGEGAPARFITGELLDGTLAAIRMLGDAIIGTDPMDIEKIHAIMDRTVAHNPSAKAALDIACYDLIGQMTQKPLYKLLGGYDDHFKTDITVGIDEPEVMAARAKAYVEDGFSTIKTKVGTSEPEDIARIKAIREAVGPDALIRVDANQGWSAKEALRIIDKISAYEIELVEQPVPAYDLEGLAQVTRSSAVPIMADESALDSKSAMRLAAMHAVDVINIKLMKCGGLHEALKINHIAESAGIQCMIGCMGEETNIGITAAAHLASALKNITRADLDATLFLKSLPVKGGVEVRHGKLVLPDSPGLGIRKV